MVNHLFRLTLAGLMPLWAVMLAPMISDRGLVIYALGLALIGLAQVALLRPYVKAAKAEARAAQPTGGL